MNVQPNKYKTVYTPLGKGRVVYTLPDKSVCVEFEHGGGRVFRPGELLQPGQVGRAKVRFLEVAA